MQVIVFPSLGLRGTVWTPILECSKTTRKFTLRLNLFIYYLFIFFVQLHFSRPEVGLYLIDNAKKVRSLRLGIARL